MAKKSYLSDLGERARLRGRWRRGVAALGVLVAIVVVAALTMPAVTAEARRASLTLGAQGAAAGEPITVTVDAAAADDAERTVFCLRADAQNAGVSPEVAFSEEGVAQLATKNGGTVTVQAVPGDGGNSSYLFAVERGESVSFDMTFVSGGVTPRLKSGSAEEIVAALDAPSGLDAMDSEGSAEAEGTSTEANPEAEASGDGATETVGAAEVASPKIALEVGDSSAAGSVSLSVSCAPTAAEAFAAGEKDDGAAIEPVVATWLAADEVSASEAGEAEPADSTEADAQPAADLTPLSDVPGTVVDEGTISGTNLTWRVERSDAGEQTLVVSGEGAIPNMDNGKPWAAYASRIKRVVIEPGVTSIGSSAFGAMGITEVSIGPDVETISTNAFSYNGIVNLVIPGNVKTVSSASFGYNYSLKSVVFEEGFENYKAPFTSFVDGTRERGLVIKLPSTLKSFSADRAPVDAYEVAEGGDYFAVDGVLYKKKEDGSWLLVKFPSSKHLDRYVVPDQVSELASGSLKYLQNVQKLVIPDTVTVPIGAGGSVLGDYNGGSGTAVVSVEFGKNVTFASMSNLFASCGELQSIVWPETTGTESVTMDRTFDGCKSLSQGYVPQNVTKLGLNSFNGCLTMQSILYDAENATITNANNLLFFAEIVVGGHVDSLSSTFSYFSPHAESITFAADNAFTVEDGAFAGMGAPLEGLSGTVYVDSKGILYTYDATAQTATVAYVPDGLDAATIPASITVPADEPADLGPGITCTVTAVGQKAFQQAAAVISVSFDNADAITSVGTYAFANCTKLESVNGKGTVEDATQSFPSAQDSFGYNAFYNTALDGAEGTGEFSEQMDGQKGPLGVGDKDDLKLSFSSSGDTLTEMFHEDGTGGYRLLTGDTLTVSADLSHTTESAYVYRVYVRLSSDEGTLDIVPGNHYTYEVEGIKIEADCYATEDPQTVYLEFAPPEGSGTTARVPITANYPVHETGGGGITVWGVELTPAESAEQESQLIEPADGDYLQAYWTTEPDTFSLTKTAATTAVSVAGTDESSDEGSVVRPDKSLVWTIALSHSGTEGETSTSYGHDHVTSVDMEDRITLPAGMSWDPEVLAAIEDGDIRKSGNNLYAGDTQIASLSFSPAITLPSFTVAFDDNDTPDDSSDDALVFSWRYRNLDDAAEATLASMSFSLLPAATIVDAEKFVSGSEVNNSATAHVHFHYAEDQDPSASDGYPLAKANGKLAVSKTASSITYFGEDVTYTIDVNNAGALPFKAGGQGDYTLADELDKNLYLKPANIEGILEEAAANGYEATVTITNASLVPDGWKEVTGAEGGTAWQHPGNTDLKDATGGHTLTVTGGNYTEDGIKSYTVTDEEGNFKTATTVEEALQQIGYGFSGETTYAVSWKLCDENDAFEMYAGEHELFNIVATFKDTFMLLGNDWPARYQSDEPLTASNQAELTGPGASDGTSKVDQTVPSKRVSVSAKREAVISKGVTRDGETLLGSFDVEDGDVLDYRLDFTHYGTGSYENLPMVDDLYGTQYLLVPVEENKDNASIKDVLGDDPATHLGSDGEQYYALTPKEDGAAATYTDVVVGVDSDTGNTLKAATITVAPAEEESVSLPSEGDSGPTTEEHTFTGLHTHIEWYFSSLKSEDGGDYVKSVTYQALVDTSLGGTSYTVGNTVWMNNKTGQRLVAALWGGGTLVDFQKDIVAERGDMNDVADDQLVQERHSLVAAGDVVTYRLELRNPANDELTLPASAFADALPQTYGTFAWSLTGGSPNVTVDVVTDGTVSLSEGTGWNDWKLVDAFGAMTAQAGQQYLTLPEDSSIIFQKQGCVYVYVTLTFPTDVEGGDQTWSAYAAANAGATVTNTLYVYGFQENVTHQLREEGEVLLQKGVYGMSSNTDIISGGSGTWDEVDERTFYSTSDQRDQAVTYYIALVNGGNKRLYLDTLYDRLPEGFTFRVLMPDALHTNRDPDTALSTTCTLKGETSSVVANPLVSGMSVDGQDVQLKSATVRVTKDGQKLSFDISAGAGDAAIKYDDEVGRYYLDRGEGIVFGYIARTPELADSADEALNAVAMPYVDEPETGVSLLGTDELTVTAHADDQHSAQPNDGTRELISAGDAQASYGFEDADGAVRWLASEVTVRRGSVEPGITKEADTFTKEGGVTQDYETSIGPYDTLTWKITLHNGGSQTLQDYVVEDVLPQPFSFEGPITCQVFGPDGESWSSSQTIATIAERTSGDSAVTIPANQGWFYRATTLGFDGREANFTSGDTGSLAFDREEGTDNEVVRIHLKNASHAVPSGGTVVITLTCRNTTNRSVQTAYTNLARVTPKLQDFTTGSGQGIEEDADEDGMPESVYATAPVTVAFANATSAAKTVTQVGDPSNTGSSTTPAQNTIVLPSAETSFRYDLTVTNSTDAAMTKLVLIDGLPSVGDHNPFEQDVPRGSGFAVALAKTPDFAVSVDTGDGATELNSRYYTVQYSVDTAFGARQGADWKGENEGTTAKWVNREAWTDPLSDVRSIRVVIRDEAGAQIPKDAKVTLSFTARVSGEADPSAVAYNSFGYHYAIQGAQSELEAMTSVVGVRVPSVPRIRKELVDDAGSPIAATKDETFLFTVYKGNAVDESALHTTFNVTVKQGKTASEWLTLDSLDNWTWVEDQTYTVVENPSEDGDWLLGGFKSAASGAEAYTFTYEPDAEETVVCVNRRADWGFSLLKVDGSDDGQDAPLEGAVFALYNPNESDGLKRVPEEFSDLNIQLTLERDGRTWYLAAVRQTDTNGKIDWSNLTRSEYGLVEVKAPDGYELPDDPWITVTVEEGASQGEPLKIENTHGFELPETGGTGTAGLAIAGLMLAGGAVLLARTRWHQAD